MKPSMMSLVVFCVLTLSAGWIGAFLDKASGQNPGAGPGILLWLITPFLLFLVLPGFGQGSWSWRGILFSGAPRFYLLALLAAPAVFGLSLLLAVPASAMRLAGFSRPSALLPLLTTALVSTLVKNLFEEAAWRGFLTPSLTTTGIPPLAVHLLTGVVWALWHLPYWTVFLQRSGIAAVSSLPLPVFIVVSSVSLVLSAVLYGELRLATGSLWPAYLLHVTHNLLFTVLVGGGIVRYAAPAEVLIGPNGLLPSLGLFVLGMLVMNTR